MRYIICLATLASLIVGCESLRPANTEPESVVNKHPLVEIEGTDGTVLRGELMNGAVTIDCDQGQLTLLTDHIRSIAFSPESDTVDSASVQVSGKILDKDFQLRSEHGVFTLLKERLRRISFKPDGFSSTIETPPTTRTTRPSAVRN